MKTSENDKNPILPNGRGLHDNFWVPAKDHDFHADLVELKRQMDDDPELLQKALNSAALSLLL